MEDGLRSFGRPGRVIGFLSGPAITASREIITDAKDGELTEKYYKKMIGYHQLLETFNQLTLSGNLEKKNAGDYEEEFKQFFLANEEKIRELIN